MLHDIFYALLGFVGDIIVAEEDCYRVKDGFDLLRDAEREQINRIVQLGWFYTTFQTFIQKYDLRWGCMSDRQRFQTYKAAVSQALEDVLTEYVDDITYLEQLVAKEGNIPLSHIIQHLQKYTLVFPQICGLLMDMESKKIRGCQLLDHFASVATGIPVVADVIARIVLRLRVVFLKQCFSWMVFGVLEDSSHEFFIQSKTDDSLEQANLYQRTINRLYNARIYTNATDDHRVKNSTVFDWATSYHLKLDLLPDSHVSPRFATKIMFAGKGVKLLQSSDELDEFYRFYQSDVYKYLCRGSMEKETLSKIETDGNNQYGVNSNLPDKETSGSSSHVKNHAIDKYVTTCGYTPENIQKFTENFKKILDDPLKAVDHLEIAVDEINDTISSRLWLLLKEELGFLSFVQVIRNTFLLGKGELYQIVLEGIVNQTTSPTPEVQEMDRILNESVLMNAGKLLSIDEDVLTNFMSLSLNSSNLSIRSFSSVQQSISLSGAAKLQDSTALSTNASISGSSYARVPHSAVVMLCAPYVTTPAEDFEMIWSNFLLKHVSKSTATTFSTFESKMNEEEPMNKHEKFSAFGLAKVGYVQGAIWLSSQKYVVKGFSFDINYLVNWPTIKGSMLHLQQLAINNDTYGLQDSTSIFLAPQDICLGFISCCLHSDRKLVNSNSLGDTILAEVPGSLSIGISYHARLVPGEKALRYFAKVYVKKSKEYRISSLALQKHESLSVSARTSLDSTVLNERLMNSEGISDIIAEANLDLDNNFRDLKDNNLNMNRSISSSGIAKLQVEFSRELNTTGQMRVGSPRASAVVYTMKIRLCESGATESHSDNTPWDIAVPLDLAMYVKCTGGQAYVGVLASGLRFKSFDPLKSSEYGDLQESPDSTCNFQIFSLAFKGKGVLTTYPVASPFTSTRFPDTFLRLETELSQFRSWMNLKLKINVPTRFKTVFDAESLGNYERMFTYIMKIRLVAHALERLWIARSRLITDRIFCHMRHSMHFFISNLLYYLQVDVVDSEFCEFQEVIATAVDFQTVLRAHKNFVANVLRMSLIDNASVQEGIERVLQVCLRFIAVCRLLHRAEQATEETEVYSSKSDLLIFVPPEEFAAIHKEFYSQVLFLFQIMRKVESRGFLFRLDFNGFLSSMAQGVQSKV